MQSISYSVHVHVDAPLEAVVNSFKDTMLLNAVYTKGSIATKAYNVDANFSTTMTETIIHNQLPAFIEATYTIKGVFNRCVYRFTASHGVTTIYLDSHFEFEHTQPVSKNHFIASSQKQLDAFKTACENVEITS